MYISWLTGNFYYLYNIIFKFYELCLHIYLYFGVPLFVKNFMVKFLNSIADLNLRKITHIQTFCCQKKSYAPCLKIWLLFDAFVFIYTLAVILNYFCLQKWYILFHVLNFFKILIWNLYLLIICWVVFKKCLYRYVYMRDSILKLK